MITIQLKLFATLSRFMPGNDLPGIPKEKQFPDGTTLMDLVNHLGIPDEEVKLCYVNGRYQEVDYILQDKDEVGIFPPIGGG